MRKIFFFKFCVLLRKSELYDKRFQSYGLFYCTLVSNPIYSPSILKIYSFFSRSMSRRIRRPHPSGGGTPLPPTVSEAMELVNPMTGGAEAMDTVQMRSRDFLIPGYPGTRISRRYPYFRPQLPITSHLLSIYYIQHAKICDGLTTFNALLSDRKQKNKMPTVSSFFARVFLTTYYFLLRISSLPNLRTPAQKNNKRKKKKTANKIATSATECSLIKCSF